jgi:adenylosuccinate lyase
MALGKAGADRQAMHERLRQHALAAWEAVQAGQPNPLRELLLGDPEFLHYLPAADLEARLDARQHLGDAPQRARKFAELVRAEIRHE